MGFQPEYFLYGDEGVGLYAGFTHVGEIVIAQPVTAGLYFLYKLTADFIRKVIESAKKELDECSPYTFEWTPQKEGKKIVGFCFYPILQPQFRDNDLYRQEIQKQTNLSWDLNRQVLGYLKLSLGFSDKEIKNNRAVFIAAQFELPDILGELAILKGKSRDKGNPKGYIINALKGKLKDKQG